MIGISIVSHNNTNEIISELKPHLWEGFKLVIVDNTPTIELETYCKAWGIIYHPNNTHKGFGENNNTAYAIIKSKFKLSYFACINPDILISQQQLEDIFNNVIEIQAPIASPQLINSDLTLQDNARAYPTIPQLIPRLIFNKKKPNEPIAESIWLSGAFIIFLDEVYSALGGFDERYFMYYEDVDICLRASRIGYTATLLDKHKVVHKGGYKSRLKSIRHFLWHVKSMIRYFVNTLRPHRHINNRASYR
ncbi:glycosyltransferase family 2 protein [Simiduia aestuariiviva]|uniref:Glycosyltransferase 2-like domain-containing protein n=1 Tax=Simiduia aestuariiviva TaxID=1510459 RepID=A0A839USJ4_9GAMM|nr:glycosyltransferase family 2 protein [Simiduia aestuariiviva]MBB3168357.1 hypothetical protein [Simiduia aestuariiviva]